MLCTSTAKASSRTWGRREGQEEFSLKGTAGGQGEQTRHPVCKALLHIVLLLLLDLPAAAPLQGCCRSPAGWTRWAWWAGGSSAAQFAWTRRLSHGQRSGSRRWHTLLTRGVGSYVVHQQMLHSLARVDAAPKVIWGLWQLQRQAAQDCLAGNSVGNSLAIRTVAADLEHH